MTPTRFVADASVAIGWVHPGQATPATQAMLAAIAAGAVCEVPAIWPLEVANALLVLRRRGRITERERRTAAPAGAQRPCVIDMESPALALVELSALAAKHGLSIYDAAYLELAQRRGLPLGCKDGPLLAAARKAHVALWPAS